MIEAILLQFMVHSDQDTVSEDRTMSRSQVRVMKGNLHQSLHIYTCDCDTNNILE